MGKLTKIIANEPIPQGVYAYPFTNQVPKHDFATMCASRFNLEMVWGWQIQHEEVKDIEY